MFGTISYAVCVPLAISGCIYPDMLEATDARVSSLKSDNLTFSHIHCGGIKEVTKLYTYSRFIYEMVCILNIW